MHKRVGRPLDSTMFVPGENKRIIEKKTPFLKKN
jgi:hypothetical protein